MAAKACTGNCNAGSAPDAVFAATQRIDMGLLFRFTSPQRNKITHHRIARPAHVADAE
ncbi:hypothetical protein JL2886_02872 [Phaeobacter gallaeciensis]|uniref:Uncharacterized protein n=1 Tax=Phaeobacter gallaeciensis TaxID=60890 RepID=A0A1B0ZUI4_9RHOB|nr:hypothetical protein JL2886_02872 [Phaeobacter gallaeciensis]